MTKPNRPLMGGSPATAELIKALGIELQGVTEVVLTIRPLEPVTIRVRYFADDTIIERVAECLLAERITMSQL